ncbi:MAG: sigma-70 family RNA polymerase sigma factor [Planctomycetota bacterium]
MQTGNANAIARLIEHHGSALVLYARGLCDSPDDVVQEAFLKLVGQAEMPRQPKAWLFHVVRNLALNSVRSNIRRRNREQAAPGVRQSWFEPVPEKQIEISEAVSALSNLDSEDREVVVAKIWGQMTFEEIAELTSVSAATVYRRYVASLKKLRSGLSGSRYIED